MLKFVTENGVSKPEDEFDLFGKSIACKLRRIDATDKKGAAQAQLKIQQIIFDLEFS